MWAYFCWLQKSWVCRLILKTMLSCSGLTPTLNSTISLTAGSVECSPLRQWKASLGGHLHFKEKTFSKSANIFDNNHMWCLFLNWWHLTTLRWTDVTMDIMWLFILTLTWFNDYFPLHLELCRFVSSCMKAFELQMVVQAPMSATASSNYYLDPLDQRPSIWGLGEYVASPI